MASVNRVYQNKKDSISSLALANKKKPIAYSQSITTSGVQQWLFMVPKDIGQAYSEAAGRTSRTEPSKTFSLNDTITLKIDEHYSPSVNFFNNFNPASVHRLIIKENATISDAHVRTFSNWTKLTILDLSGTDIDDDAIPYLSKIPNLSTLKIRKTLITGSGLARLRLRAPSSLTCLSLKDASKLLDSLKHSKQMTSLTLQDSNLTDDDLSKIATVTSLTNLSVADNVRLTEIGLSRLKALTKLGTIDLTGCQITASSANFLKQLRSLKSVIIDWSQWTDAQRGSFKKTLSPVEIKTLFPEKLI